MRTAWHDNALRKWSAAADTAPTDPDRPLDEARILDQADVRVSSWTLACELLHVERWQPPERKAA